MPVLDIVTHPDARLRAVAQNVEITDEIKSFCQDLIETMFAKDGLGLAAIQVGRPLRIFTLNDGGAKLFINPQILVASGKQNEPEACLSFPGVWARVERAAFVSVKAYDLDGNEFVYERDGLMARAVQHELDHCDGISFVDRLGPLKRQMVLKKYNKFIR